MRIFLPRFKKPRLEAERSALKDKIVIALHCVTGYRKKHKKNSEKGAPSTPFGVGTEAILITETEGCVPSPSLF